MTLHVLEIPSPDGHDVIEFDCNNAAAVAEAKAAFDEIVKTHKGFAVKQMPDGTQHVTREFDPTAPRTVVHQKLVAG